MVPVSVTQYMVIILQQFSQKAGSSLVFARLDIFIHAYDIELPPITPSCQLMSHHAGSHCEAES